MSHTPHEPSDKRKHTIDSVDDVTTDVMEQRVSGALDDDDEDDDDEADDEGVGGSVDDDDADNDGDDVGVVDAFVDDLSTADADDDEDELRDGKIGSMERSHNRHCRGGAVSDALADNSDADNDERDDDDDDNDGVVLCVGVCGGVVACMCMDRGSMVAASTI